MFIYAELNENNICIGISELSGEVIKDTMIKLDSYDISLLGKKYNNGVWEEVEVEVEPTETVYQPTNAEIYENQLVIMQALADLYETNVSGV